MRIALCNSHYRLSAKAYGTKEIKRALDEYIDDNLVVSEGINLGLAESEAFQNRIQGIANKLNAWDKGLSLAQRESLLRGAGRSVLKQKDMAMQDFEREQVSREEVKETYSGSVAMISTGSGKCCGRRGIPMSMSKN